MYSAMGVGVWILGVVNLIWLIGLTILVIQNKNFLQRLFPGNDGNFQAKLSEVLEAFNKLSEYKSESLNFVKSINLKRYNPYQDTGGDQSFSLVLMNSKGNGVVVTSLHSRSGTRVFAKPIKGGKESGFEFSDEEEQLVNKSYKEI